MASSPITSWQIDEEISETVRDFIFLGSKITETMKLRWLLFRRKAMTKLDSMLKSKDSTLLINVLLLKAMVFPVVTYVWM